MQAQYNFFQFFNAIDLCTDSTCISCKKMYFYFVVFKFVCDHVFFIANSTLKVAMFVAR